MTTFDMRGHGNERLLARLMEHAREQGWKVSDLTVVSPPWLPEYFYESDRRARIEKLPDGRSVTVLPRPQGDVRFIVGAKEDDAYVRVERNGDRLPIEFIVE